MAKTIIKAVVALVCTAAICVTGYMGLSKVASNQSSTGCITSASQTKEYLTEEEAAAYLGVNTNEMKMLRENLKYLKGSFMTYTYTDSNGKDVTTIIYNKDKLDSCIAALMKSDSKSNINFKYLQQAIEKSNSSK